MNNLKFTVYIGEHMIDGQHKSDIAIENVVAVVYPDFPIPHGLITLEGKPRLKQPNCFWSIEQLVTYFCDWFNIVENKNRIVADIHLNNISLHKTFRGDEIVKIIDKISNCTNYINLKSFNF
ncbi:MAG: hypothetical protein K2I75_00590 [Clostridiales bacterium]|nr:hypothetical protein [Clostridiales bacterium]